MRGRSTSGGLAEAVLTSPGVQGGQQLLQRGVSDVRVVPPWVRRYVSMVQHHVIGRETLLQLCCKAQFEMGVQ